MAYGYARLTATAYQSCSSLGFLLHPRSGASPIAVNVVPSYATVSIQSVALDLKPDFILINAAQVTKGRMVNDTLNFIGCTYM